MEILSKEQSKDNATKYLFSVNRMDKNYGIEGAFLYLPYRKLKWVICTSTQIGCNQRCSFCHISKLRFVDNLTSKEINEQFISIIEDKCLRDKENIEYALEGIGEPLLNYDNVIEAINSHKKIIKDTNFVISTVGIAPNIYRLARENLKHPTRLQISLHFSNDYKRKKFMPISNIYSIEEIIEAGRDFAIRQKNKVAINYLLINGENDSDEDISNLIKLLDKNWFYIKLSYLNGLQNFYSPKKEKFEEIKSKIEKANIETKIFRNIGLDISIGCGQLILKDMARTKNV